MPRERVATAVDAVLAGLARAEDSPRAPVANAGATVVVTFTARSAPDLASRVRKALTAAGVALLELGAATAGRHTVVTARVPAAARALLDGAAASAGAALSVYGDDA